MPQGLNSEVGRLRKVMVCRPGLAQQRLTPANCHELLFDDVLWVAQARNDHDAFTAALQARDVEVLEMHNLLADTVALPAARQWLLDHKLGPNFVDDETATQLRPWLEALSPAKLDEQIAARRHWALVADGDGWRRAVPSPQPLRVPGLDVIRGLLARGTLVIAAGGGGIPVVPRPDGCGLQGVEAVIDKDRCSALIATELQADCLIIATDVDAVYLDWGRPTQRAVGKTTPQALLNHVFAAGSMGPKVEAACAFVQATGRRAVIGALANIEALLSGEGGTQISPGPG